MADVTNEARFDSIGRSRCLERMCQFLGACLNAQFQRITFFTQGKMGRP